MDKIQVTKSSLPPFEEYVEMIRPLWDSHWLTNMGTYHQQFEQALQEYTSMDYVSLMSNGHMSLELVIQAMNFPQGSEVITTPFTFVSTTHAIIRNGLIPVFCDIKESDYTIDESKIESLITDKTVAIVPVHVYGNICNVTQIEQIAQKYQLKVIYDAAHAFGERYMGKNVAAFGDASIFSFHATKVLHTIEGGAVCTANKELYERLYNLKNFGIRNEELVVAVGANAKLNEFSCAMGLLNLKYLSEEIEKRRRVIAHYREILSGIYGLKMVNPREEVYYNGGYFPVRFCKHEMGISRDMVYDALMQENIHARKYFYPITADHKCFGEQYKNNDLKNARSCAEEVLVLPVYADLTLEEVERICNIIQKMCEG